MGMRRARSHNRSAAKRWLLCVAVVVVCCSCLVTSVQAQTEPEYKMEVGAGAGLMNYLGDLNRSPLKGLKPMGGLVLKYKMNPRMAWSVGLNYSQLKGSSSDVTTWYPDLAEQPVDFKTNVVNFDVRYEYNFWPFGTGREYRGAQPLTPFIALGAGLVFAKCNDSQAGLQVPIGLGVKYKLKQRLNLTAEWMMHISSFDHLDGLKDPYGIKSSGLFKNTDCFGTLQVSITYEFMERCRTCHNDRED